MASIRSDTWMTGQWGISGGAGPVDFDSDAIFMALLTPTGDGVADATKQGWQYKSDVTNEHAQTGNYTTGGLILTTPAVSVASHVKKFTSDARAWSPTFTISAGGMILFKRVGADLTTPTDDPFIGYWTFGATIASTNGVFTVTPNASGWMTES